MGGNTAFTVFRGGPRAAPVPCDLPGTGLNRDTTALRREPHCEAGRRSYLQIVKKLAMGASPLQPSLIGVVVKPNGMDKIMNSFPTQAILGAGAVIVAAVAVVLSGSLSLAIGLISTAVMSALAAVAFSTQSARLRDERRLVYRPVYVRRHDMRQRVRSDD